MFPFISKNKNQSGFAEQPLYYSNGSKKNIKLTILKRENKSQIYRGRILEQKIINSLADKLPINFVKPTLNLNSMLNKCSLISLNQ